MFLRFHDGMRDIFVVNYWNRVFLLFYLGFDMNSYNQSDTSTSMKINDILKEKSKKFSADFDRDVYISGLRKRFQSSKVDNRGLFRKIFDYFKGK